MLLPGAIAHLKAHHPLLMVVVREGTPEQLLTDLEAGAIDIVVGRLTAPTDHAFIRETLYTESVQLVARVKHPASANENLHLSDTLTTRGYSGYQTLYVRNSQNFSQTTSWPCPTSGDRFQPHHPPIW
ncbi:LysR substrate-binding domain-containing protein [Rhodococcus baikonurensis]|uniref:LysR substrate-binding domain-containing protein n=1 Tax=Rhodococcus baikonurensis TaxID=172041 RepID=UPI00379E7808